MQVKKFEAATMKEALLMVKRDLGPEAIILSAKDNSQNFGLLGNPSIEITAAVSEKMMQKKKTAEKKMRVSELEKFRTSSAQAQNKFIGRVHDQAAADMQQRHQQHQQQQQQAKRTVTAQRYIDIEEEAVPQAPKRSRVELKMVTPDRETEISSLKQEINRLKNVIQEFQKVPQNFISVHPGAEKGVSFEFSSIYQKLKKAGLSEETVLALVGRAKDAIPVSEHRKEHIIDAWMAQEILQTTQVVDSPFEGYLHVFTGVGGQGKTSSLVKLAGEMVVRQRRKVALLTADTFRVGAAEQLKIFSQILNVPFATVRGPQDWHHILSELKDYDHLLLDFPSIPFKEMGDIDLAKRLLPPATQSCRTHLVVSATAKSQDVSEMMRRHRIMKVNDVIFTKLDESVNHGLIYDFQRSFGVPLHSFGIGSRIPEDFEMATRERVLDLIFRLTRINSERGE